VRATRRATAPIRQHLALDRDVDELTLDALQAPQRSFQRFGRCVGAPRNRAWGIELEHVRFAEMRPEQIPLRPAAQGRRRFEEACAPRAERRIRMGDAPRPSDPSAIDPPFAAYEPAEAGPSSPPIATPSH
jgi:hypothetical protein